MHVDYYVCVNKEETYRSVRRHVHRCVYVDVTLTRSRDPATTSAHGQWRLPALLATRWMAPVLTRTAIGKPIFHGSRAKWILNISPDITTSRTYVSVIETVDCGQERANFYSVCSKRPLLFVRGNFSTRTFEN
jgi:hypothetical protein